MAVTLSKCMGVMATAGLSRSVGIMAATLSSLFWHHGRKKNK